MDTALDPRWINRAFAALAAQVGVEASRHNLRHSAVTALLAAHHPVAVVSEHRGHSSPLVTMPVYARSLPTARRAFAAALGELLG